MHGYPWKENKSFKLFFKSSAIFFPLKLTHGQTDVSNYRVASLIKRIKNLNLFKSNNTSYFKIR